MRAEQRKQTDKRKLELSVRRRTLASILAKVESPLPKTDLQLVTAAFFHYLPNDYKMALCQHHGVKAQNGQPGFKSVNSAFETLLKSTDEARLSKLLVEMALFDPTTNLYADRADVLDVTAKRHRISVEKIRQTVSADFATKRKKRDNNKALRDKTGVSSKRASR